MNSQLLPHEWIAVVTIVLLMGFFGTIALFDDEPFEPPQDTHQTQLPRPLTVTISGAVQNPGEYCLQAGTTVGDLLELTQPLPSADLRRIKPSARLRNGRSIIIRERPMITLSITGAVKEPGIMRVPKNTTFQQLLSLINLTDDADISKTIHKQRLRDHDIIEIPFVQQPQNLSVGPPNEINADAKHEIMRAYD